MNNFLSDQVMELWQKEYSSHLTKYSKFDSTHQFHQIARMCTPGQSFFYILNFSDLSLDFIDPNVENVIGIKPSEVNMETLLQNTLTEELKIIQQKEKITTDFFYNYLHEEDYLNYKIIYAYKCKGIKGRNQTMLIQSTPLSLTGDGKIEHVFGIHSDISHLGNLTTDWVSFISLKGEKSYLNIKAKHERFDPKLANLEKSSITHNLTKREKEIIKLLSQGLTAQAIAEELFISFNTVRTHRKNILAKTNCQNSAELIGKCLSGGLI